MAARIIYLDQNKWIELARAIHGRGHAHLRPMVDLVRQMKASGLAVFPLSLAHHMETSKRFDAGQQERLGEFMWEISDGLTLASPKAILQFEIDTALQRTFQTTLNVRPFDLVRKGLGHAVGKPVGFTINDPDNVLQDTDRVELEEFADRVFAYSVLTGTTPWGPAPRPRPDLSPPGKQFVANMTALRTKLASAPVELRRQTVYSILLNEILDALLAALALHGISVDQFAQLGLDNGPEGYIRVLEQMPSVRVNAHLYMQWLQNPQLPFRENDLNDWYYVGAAAAHADVVVTERHFAHVVNSGGLVKKAAVISDLMDLPSS